MYGPKILNQFNLIIKEIQMFILNIKMNYKLQIIFKL